MPEPNLPDIFSNKFKNDNDPNHTHLDPKQNNISENNIMKSLILTMKETINQIMIIILKKNS